jgi:predicted phosphoribosyltransferase
MNDEEADALDEELTRTIPELGPNGEGFFSGKGRQIIVVDEGTARILNAKALATHRTPSELVAEMVREQLASAAM